jgi:RNA polymerase subunit RPABC4/transcription elongation factor Spt4
MCGIGEKYKDYPYLYYQSFDEDEKSMIYRKAVCVNKCPSNKDDEIKCLLTSFSSECPKTGTLNPSVRWFGECVLINPQMTMTPKQLEGKAYIDRNHDKIFSFFMDFINNSV